MYGTLLRHALFPAYETLKRRGTLAAVEEYDASQWLDADALARLQLRKLNALLAHCWEHVPFLREHWRAAGCSPAPLADLSELARYPLLTKALVNAHREDMIARPWRGRTLAKATGGSTGEPFRCEYTMRVYARRTAVMWRDYAWGGAPLGTRIAYLWGTGLRAGGWGGLKDRLYHSAYNRRFFEAWNITDANIDARIEAIRAYRPGALVGYVAPVVRVAQRMLATGARIPGLAGVLTGAEALHAAERDVIERAFGCKAFDTYGSREVMLMAAECERHEGLHVNADHLLLETVDEDGVPVSAGTSGAVAITDFHNPAMPLVRYLNGDAATYATHACTCGRGLPLLASVDGRLLDLIRTPDGRLVPGEYFVYIMLSWPMIAQWQVVQTARDAIEIRVIASTPLDPELCDRLRSSMRRELGDRLRVDIVPVEHIDASGSGKRRLTVALSADASGRAPNR